MSVRKDWQLRDRIESDWGNELGIGRFVFCDGLFAQEEEIRDIFCGKDAYVQLTILVFA